MCHFETHLSLLLHCVCISAVSSSGWLTDCESWERRLTVTKRVKVQYQHVSDISNLFRSLSSGSPSSVLGNWCSFTTGANSFGRAAATWVGMKHSGPLSGHLSPGQKHAGNIMCQSLPCSSSWSVENIDIHVNWATLLKVWSEICIWSLMIISSDFLQYWSHAILIKMGERGA